MQPSDFLTQAAAIVSGDRATDYGHYAVCHSRIAELWSCFIGYPITPHDVACMMTLLKLARIKTGTRTEDCYVDAAGYIGIAGALR